MKRKYLSIIIENISDGEENGYMATIPELNNSIVFGCNLKELYDGIDMAMEDVEKYFKKGTKKPVLRPKKGAHAAIR